MSDKKGGVPAEQMTAVVVVIILLTISALIFTTCVAQDIKQEYEKWEFIKDEIDAIKTLNHFLLIRVDEERNVMDLIIESYLEDDYDEFDAIAHQYFGAITNNWVFEISERKPPNQIGDQPTPMHTTGEGIVQLFVPLDSGSFETIFVILYIGPNLP